MSKLKIIAKEISNLTDARYFAAMGVHYLGFDLTQDPLKSVEAPFIKQVKEWVSGPLLLGYFSAFEDPQDIREKIQDIGLDAIAFDVFAEEEQIRSFPQTPVFRQSRIEMLEASYLEEGSHIIHFEEAKEVDDILTWLKKADNTPDKLYIDGPVSPSLLSADILDRISGIVIKGGEEEKTGYKSFDELDQLFEWLDTNSLL